MHLVVWILESTFNNILTALFSTSESFKIKTDIVNKFVNATTDVNIQNSVDKFSVASDNFGLIISAKKTEVIDQPVPGKPYVEPNITLKGQQPKVVENFTYLLSWMMR